VARFADVDGLGIEQLFDGKGIVHFQHIQIRRRDLGLSCRKAHDISSERGVGVQIVARPFAARSGGSNPHGAAHIQTQPLDTLFGGKNDRRAALADWGALQGGD